MRGFDRAASRRLRLCSTAGLISLLIAGAGAHAQETLPEAGATPLAIDFSADPILQLKDRESAPQDFRNFIAGAVARNPARLESRAQEDEADALLEQARESRLPSIDASITSYRVIDRAFSNDPDNIIERSRATQRTDALLNVTQTLVDFGASSNRVRAAGARLRAAGADLEVAADRVALEAIASWYDVFGYRALVELSEAFIAGQVEARASVQSRIDEGVSAEVDIARIDNLAAQGQVRLARYRRLLASAEARFEQQTGTPAPATLGRAPAIGIIPASADAAAFAARGSPQVRSAEALASAADREMRAARADRLPQISAGIDAGRYGVFETERDYDIRGRLQIRQRIFGGVDGRAEQFEARARGAVARADRVREEATREAAIAWADVRALEQQLVSLEAAYRTSRQTRDAIVTRFVSARGDLFDVTAAEDAYFESATAYIQALMELDAARYVLLSRTGRLLDALDIDPGPVNAKGERL